MNKEVESNNDSLLIDEVDIDKWRKEIRTRVKALKCHIMASKGLSANGEVSESYSPRKLLEEEINFSELTDTMKRELTEYVEVALARITVNKVQETNNEASAIFLDDVQFTLDLDNIPQDSSDQLDSSNKMDKIAQTPDETIQSSRPGLLFSSDNNIESCHNSESNCFDEIKETLSRQTKEIAKLSKIRDEVENELQDLTANLFQEAHSMVLGANQRAAIAEKALKETNMQVEVLQAEVYALKSLVITSTPSTPNPHLHPQIISRGAQVIADAGKIFQRGHKKSPSDFDLKYGRDTTPPSSPLKDSKLLGSAGLSNGFALDPDCWEVDPILHKEFVFWRQNPVLSRDNPFMSRVYSEDIDLCLTFPNSTLAHKVNTAVEDNALYIEEVNPRQKNCPKKCVLLEVPRYCKYRFRLGEKDDTWYYISQFVRNRITAVCDFLNYLRYIQLGLVKSSIHDVYWEIVKLRRQMSMARLGF